MFESVSQDFGEVKSQTSRDDQHVWRLVTYVPYVFSCDYEWVMSLWNPHMIDNIV